MGRSLRCAAVVMVGGLLSAASARVAAQAPNVPVFSLWATEVSDGLGGLNKCTSCPTQHVPVGEIAPGDVVRVELFISNWDAQPARGRCDGDPTLGQAGQCTNISSASPCPGTHCSDCPGTGCHGIAGCSGCGNCAQNICQAYPKLSAYMATVDGGSLQSGASGVLVPYPIPCYPAECAIVADGTCPCAQFYQTANECTCVVPSDGGCDVVTNRCGIESALFIESLRSDYLFFSPNFDLSNDMAVEEVSPEADGDVLFSAVLRTPLIDAVLDLGTRRQLGTMLLEVSDDASGVFVISYVRSGATFALNASQQPLDGASYQDLTINLWSCCQLADCDDGNLCTIDEPDCGDASCATCMHRPKVCGSQQTCNPVNGACVAFPDLDDDMVHNSVDNCPNVANTNQRDCDDNGVGDVCDQVCGGQIEWTTFPADGAIDAREDVDAATGMPAGLTVISASFACFVGAAASGDLPGAEDFLLTDTSGGSIAVVGAAAQDDCLLEYTVTSGQALRPGEWTTLAIEVVELHAQGMTPVSALLVSDVGFLPGDVDGSTWTDVFDVAALRQTLMQGAVVSEGLLRSADIDRSGALTAFDLVREVDLLNGANSTRVWNGEALPVKPN